MKIFITRHEPNKGYIIGDKLHINGIAFEKFSFSHIPELSNRQAILVSNYLEDVYTNKPKKYEHNLESLVLDFLAYAGINEVDTKVKYFYFNFNHDGVCIFINRNI